jgi:hypothetical protein
MRSTTRNILPTVDGSLLPSVALGRHGTPIFAFFIVALAATVSVAPASTVTFIASMVVVLIAGSLTGHSPLRSAGGILTVVTGWMFRFDISGLPTTSLLIGLAAATLCFLPLATWRRQPNRLPLFGAFCAVQGVYIYMGAFVAHPSATFQVIYPLEVREVGLEATLAYVAALVAAGLLVRSRPVAIPDLGRRISRILAPGAINTVFARAVFLVIVGILAARFIPGSIASHLGAIPQIVGLARIVGVSLMVILWLRGQLRLVQKVATLTAIGIDIIAGTTGQFALYQGAGCAIAVLIILAIFRTQVAIWLLVVLLPLAIVLNIAKTEARETKSPSTGHLAALYTLAQDASASATHPNRLSWAASADRFDYSDLLGYAVEHIPRDFSYWNKQSYTELPFVLVPRVLDPFKPSDTLANEFGRRYGLISPDDFDTSVNTPIQVEAWANFGAPGMISLAVLIGALLATVEGWFDPRRIDGLVLGVVVAYEAAGGVESGIDAFALAAPIVWIYGPIVRWALTTGSATLARKRIEPSR